MALSDQASSTGPQLTADAPSGTGPHPDATTAATDDPAVAGLVAFLAGFSEPCRVGTLDRTAGQRGGMA